MDNYIVLTTKTKVNHIKVIFTQKEDCSSFENTYAWTCWAPSLVHTLAIHLCMPTASHISISLHRICTFCAAFLHSWWAQDHHTHIKLNYTTHPFTLSWLLTSMLLKSSGTRTWLWPRSHAKCNSVFPSLQNERITVKAWLQYYDAMHNQENIVQTHTETSMLLQQCDKHATRLLTSNIGITSL